MAMWKSLPALIFYPSTTWKGLLIFWLTLHYISATSISFKSERATQLILKTGLSKCYLDISLSTMLILSAHNASFALEKLNLADTNWSGTVVPVTQQIYQYFLAKTSHSSI
jgi:hypothetical protein